jgi:uncharacterized cupin superfamily protein
MCAVENSRAWRGKYPERKKAVSRAEYDKNREKYSARQRQARGVMKENIALRQRDYYLSNKGNFYSAVWRRRAAKLRAIPAWYGELDSLVMIEAADLCAIRQQTTGVSWHVDHMVPLQARNACGLHCAENVQVIPAKMNIAKRNHMRLTQPLEWLKHI